jgi:hypothetical protein
MLLLTKLIVSLICGVCDAIGGWHLLYFRRYFIPIILGVSFVFITNVWWTLFLPLPAIGTLSIGYSKDGNFGRALWIGLQCFVFGLGMVLVHHLALVLYIPYIILGCVLGGLYRNWNQIIGDMITGCYMGLIIFLVH